MWLKGNWDWSKVEKLRKNGKTREENKLTGVMRRTHMW